MSALKKQTSCIQLGLGLVEMMVAMAIGMVILSGVFYLSTGATKASRDNIRMSFLNQELSNVINLMTKDFRRASYWGGAVDAARVSTVSTLIFSTNTAGLTTIAITNTTADVYDSVVDSFGAQAIGEELVYLERSSTSPYNVMKYTATITAYTPSTNTFTATLNNAFPATVLAAGGGAPKGSWTIYAPVNEITVSLSGDDCALFGYDINGDGEIANSSLGEERLGFRYDSTEQAVEIRKNAGNCSATGWENITDESSVAITNFAIEELPTSLSSGTLTIDIREYSIVITGNLKSDPSIVRTLRETIRVRNDKVT